MANLGLGITPVEDRKSTLGLFLTNRIASVAVVFFGEVDISGGRTIVADLSSMNAARPVAEDERGNDVSNAKRDCDDAGCHDSLPNLEWYVLVVVSIIAERTKMVASHKNHSDAEPGEAAVFADCWPVLTNHRLTHFDR